MKKNESPAYIYLHIYAGGNSASNERPKTIQWIRMKGSDFRVCCVPYLSVTVCTIYISGWNIINNEITVLVMVMDSRHGFICCMPGHGYIYIITPCLKYKDCLFKWKDILLGNEACPCKDGMPHTLFRCSPKKRVKKREVTGNFFFKM